MPALLPLDGPLVVGTYNGGNAGQRAAAADLDRLTPLVHVLAEQEVARASAQGKAMVAFAEATGWQLHRGTGGGMDRTGVLVHPDLRILDRDFHLCTDRRFVGKWGAGGDKDGYLGRKYGAWVTVEDPATGHPVTVLSHHLVASTQRPAVSKAAREARERRRRLYDDHVDQLLVFADDHPEALILAGDYNAGPGYARLNPLRAAGFTVATARTHGVRRIDHLWSRDAR